MKSPEELDLAIKVARAQLAIAERSWRHANRQMRDATDAAKVAACHYSECQRYLNEALQAAIPEEAKAKCHICDGTGEVCPGCGKSEDRCECGCEELLADCKACTEVIGRA